MNQASTVNNLNNAPADFHTVNIEALATRCLPLFEETSEEQTSPIYAELRELKSLSERYKDPAEIARGGMKSIKKVYDIATCHDVAMAELHEDIDQAFHEVFLREARLTALLDHPNIMSVHEIGLKPDGAPYFIMDLKPGDSLEDILKEIRQGNRLYTQPFHIESRLQIFSKVCDAVEYAHANHVIHLDLKPANIQVGQYGEVLLCDWGLAKILNLSKTRTHMDLMDDDADLDEMLLNHDILNHMTFTTEIKGTPGYMSPEQIEVGGTKDKASDIYALGAILYSLYKFTPPVEGEIKDVLRKTKAGQIKSLDEIPTGIAAIIRRAMALNKDDRYESVSQLKEDLHKYLSGFATEAENASAFKEISLFIKRHQTAATVALLALLILTGVTSGFIIHLRSQNQALALKSEEALTAQALAEKSQVAAIASQEEAEASQKIAEKSQREAEASQKKAEALATQYLQEKDRQLALSQQLTQKHLDEIERLLTTFIYEMPRVAVDNSLKSISELLLLNPKNPKAIERYIHCHFIAQRFNEILEIDSTGTGSWDLINYAKNYKDFFGKEAKVLRQDKFRALVLDMVKKNKRTPLMVRMMIYDNAVRHHMDPDFRLTVLKDILKQWNPEWDGDDTGLQFKASTGDLTINTDKLTQLTSNLNISKHCPLFYINPKKLTLGGQGSYDLLMLKGLKISILDISDAASIENLNAIRKFQNLKHLIAREDQLSPDIRKLIHNRVRVSIRDNAG